MATRQLSTAAERREALIEAAVATFAERGFHGTPTTEVARAAGISQAYLFRLFPTKSDLYVAAVERCYERLSASMNRGAEEARRQGLDPLDGMGMAYLALMQDRTTLQATLHAFAAGATDDPAIRAAVRKGYGDLYALCQRLSGADADRMRAFFAQGMLCTVLAGMDAPSIDAGWAQQLLGGHVEGCAAEENAESTPGKLLSGAPSPVSGAADAGSSQASGGGSVAE